MEVGDAWQAVNAVSYFPGWELTVEDGNHEGPYIRVYAVVPNAYRDGGPVELDIHIPIGDILAITDLTIDQFYSWLSARLQRIAIHEHHEWFQIDGMPWVDPHADGYGLESKAS